MRWAFHTLERCKVGIRDIERSGTSQIHQRGARGHPLLRAALQAGQRILFAPRVTSTVAMHPIAPREGASQAPGAVTPVKATERCSSGEMPLVNNLPTPNVETPHSLEGIGSFLTIGREGLRKLAIRRTRCHWVLLETPDQAILQK